MKKNYELVEIKVISLDNADVITASGSANTRSNLFGGNFVDGSGLGTQEFE